MNVLLLIQDSTEKMILSTALQQSNLTVHTVHTLKDMTTLLASNAGESAKLIMASLPNDDPFTIVRQVRDVTTAPLIMVVEPLIEEQQRSLLTAGATLVLARPYSTCRLITQSLALLRDMNGGLSAEISCLSSAELTLDPLSHTVQVRKEPPQQLSPLECQLLHTLMRHPHQTLPIDLLLEHLYGCPSKGSRKMVRKVVSRLRAKIEPDTRNPRYVITIPTVGYAFNDL